MLVFACVTPHPPLLIPLFQKKEGVKLESTMNSLKQLEEYLYLSRAETVVVITPHAKTFDRAFSMNLHERCVTDYRAFGDLSTKQVYNVDLALASNLTEAANQENIKLRAIATDTLDHGAGVPLGFLLGHNPQVKILPIGTSASLSKEHFDFGYMIKKVIMESPKRIGLVCSADLSHALETKSPAGFSKEGKEFDAKIQEVLTGGNTSSLLQIQDDFISKAATCGFKPIVTLLGALQRVDFTVKILSYEAPFGVGYVTAHFAL